MELYLQELLWAFAAGLVATPAPLCEIIRSSKKWWWWELRSSWAVGFLVFSFLCGLLVFVLARVAIGLSAGKSLLLIVLFPAGPQVALSLLTSWRRSDEAHLLGATIAERFRFVSRFFLERIGERRTFEIDRYAEMMAQHHSASDIEKRSRKLVDAIADPERRRHLTQTLNRICTSCHRYRNPTHRLATFFIVELAPVLGLEKLVQGRRAEFRLECSEDAVLRTRNRSEVPVALINRSALGVGLLLESPMIVKLGEECELRWREGAIEGFISSIVHFKADLQRIGVKRKLPV